VKSLLGIEAKILSLVGRRLAEAGAKRINNNNHPEKDGFSPKSYKLSGPRGLEASRNLLQNVQVG
jgi:hypothetical protein